MTGRFFGDLRVALRRLGRTPRVFLQSCKNVVVIELSSGAVITFNDPRRFGLMDLLRLDRAGEHAVLGSLGPEPLDDRFNATVLARACAGKRAALKVVLPREIR
jgi:formamidopyrimidine-DNA glycosylase